MAERAPEDLIVFDEGLTASAAIAAHLPARLPGHGFLTRGGRPVGPFGVMGGHMQPQGHVQLVMSTVDDGLDPQAALDLPRWYWHAGRELCAEPELGVAAVDALRRRGHRVTVEESTVYGYGQAIWRADGGYVAGSPFGPEGDAIAGDRDRHG